MAKGSSSKRSRTNTPKKSSSKSRKSAYREMLTRRLTSVFRSSPTSKISSSTKDGNEGKKGSFGRKAVSFMLLTVTGGVALSALDDLAIYRGCSCKAMEKASKNQAIKDAIGEPIVKGPWYNASLAVAHQRHSVSCTFPVSGPRGNGVFQLKAVRNGDDSWLSFFLSREWDILLMEALVYVPTNEEKQQTMRITVSDNSTAPDCTACTKCPQQESEKPETK